jgi:malate dehydrogenase (oxaloacetate-decarboxylating)
MNYNQQSINLHKKHRGKIEIKLKVPLKTKKDLSLAYTPGVAAVCSAIARQPKRVNELTNRGNQVAIVTDGTAVLGLGNIGPAAGLPVMEGKAAIFKAFANIDAVPLCIKAQNADEIVSFVKQIEPSFAGINLEDISAPRCFEVTEKLEKELSIPVFHDDQDGTAIVVLAALINAARLLRRDIRRARVVINGAGAAGLAIAKLLLAYKVKDIIVLDSRGTIYAGRVQLNPYKKAIAAKTNLRKIKGDLRQALKGADVFIGVSKANLVDKAMVQSMNPGPIILAMANPVPEIMPAEALAAGAAVVGTGRSDLPNQINNALVFPGIFRGLLDYNIRLVTNKIKLAAAQAIADSIKPSKNKLLPPVTDKKVVSAIKKAIKRAG